MKLDADKIRSALKELERLAGRLLRRERHPGTLQTSDLVNEAYLRLHGSRDSFTDDAHFMASAAHAMRRVLIDHARKRRALKRQHGLTLVDLDEAVVQTDPDLDGFLAVDRALRRLEKEDPSLAQMIELRFFGGLNLEETSRAMGISTRTVKRKWAEARERLQNELSAKRK